MNSILISVIIPIFRVEKYLRQCIDSVLSQNYSNTEIILVDDGSPDECPKICDEYAIRDQRVRVIHKKNGGLSDARNEGLKLASGDYVLFLDSDDYYAHPDFIDAIVEATANGTKDAVFFQRTVYYENSNRPREEKTPYNLEWNSLDPDILLLDLAKNDQLDASACMKATKRSILLNNGLSFKIGLYSEDIEWFSRYVTCIRSIALINKPDYCYRKREGSISTSLTEKNVSDLFYTIRMYSSSIRDSKMNPNRVLAILSYHSYQYYIVLGLAYNCIKGCSRLLFLKECKSYKWRSSYSISKKTQKCALVLKLLGVYLSSIVFGCYIKHK